MSDRIRCGVIGLGQMGQAHAHAIATSGRGVLAACCDLDPSRAGGVPEGASFTTDPGALIARPDIDAVFVATPEPAHAPLVAAALQAGKHVLCEKPMAHTLEAADAMIAAARDSGSLLCIGHVSRFDPRYAAVRRALDEGAIGSPHQLSASRVSHTDERDYYGARTTLALELAIHDLDLMRWFAGDIARVFGLSSEPTAGAPPDSLVAVIGFRSGAVGSLECSWGLPRGRGLEFGSTLSVTGDNGFAFVDARGSGVRLHVDGGAQLPDLASAPALYGATRGVLGNEVEHFLACVAGVTLWPLTLADARAALAAALALDDSLATGRPVDVDPAVLTTTQETGT